jgi:hypothetical protein
MKKRIIGISLVAVLAIALVATGVAVAQGRGHGGPGGRGPNGPVEGEEGPLHELMETYLADALGISPEDFEARRDGGETFIDIALDLGYEIDEARQLMLAARDAAIEEGIEQGLIDEGWAEGMPHGFGRGGYDGECPYGAEGMGQGPRGGGMGMGR